MLSLFEIPSPYSDSRAILTRKTSLCSGLRLDKFKPRYARAFGPRFARNKVDSRCHRLTVSTRDPHAIIGPSAGPIFKISLREEQ